MCWSQLLPPQRGICWAFWRNPLVRAIRFLQYKQAVSRYATEYLMVVKTQLNCLDPLDSIRSSGVSNSRNLLRLNACSDNSSRLGISILQTAIMAANRRRHQGFALNFVPSSKFALLRFCLQSMHLSRRENALIVCVSVVEYTSHVVEF